MGNTAAKNHSFLKNQFPAIFWSLLIFVLSSIPNLKGPQLHISFQDKIYHFLFYAFYGYLLSRAFSTQTRWPLLKNKYVLITIIFGCLFALSDEFHQSFVPGRMMDKFDFLADAMGICAGAFLCLYWERFKGMVQKKT